MQGFPFAPSGQTVAVTPTGTSQNVSLPAAVSGQPGLQLRFRNAFTADVFVTFGSTAVLPTVGTPQNGVMLAAGSIEILTPPAGTQVVAYIESAAGSGTLYISQGDGL